MSAKMKDVPVTMSEATAGAIQRLDRSEMSMWLSLHNDMFSKKGEETTPSFSVGGGISTLMKASVILGSMSGRPVDVRERYASMANSVIVDTFQQNEALFTEKHQRDQVVRMAEEIAGYCPEYSEVSLALLAIFGDPNNR